MFRKDLCDSLKIYINAIGFQCEINFIISLINVDDILLRIWQPFAHKQTLDGGVSGGASGRLGGPPPEEAL